MFKAFENFSLWTAVKTAMAVYIFLSVCFITGLYYLVVGLSWAVRILLVASFVALPLVSVALLIRFIMRF